MFKHFLIKTRRTLPSALAIGAALMAVPAANAIDRFVSIYNPSPGAGGTWNTASHDLQAIIDLSIAGDRVLVGQGIYTRIGGNKELNFILKDGVRVEGGYAGWKPDGTLAPDPFARDLIAYESTLSGDFLGNDGPGFANRADNAYHVVVAAGIEDDQRSTLDGFTISGGQADNDEEDEDPFPVILRPNHRANGAGLYAINSKLNVIRCTFTDNLADGVGFRGLGGGAYVTGFLSGPEGTDFIDCVFKNNSANRGGAITVEGTQQLVNEDPPISTKATFTNCLIYDNLTVKPDPFTAGDGAAGVYLQAQVKVEMINCTVANNRGK